MIKIEFHNDREPALDETTLNQLQTNMENAVNQAVVYASTETECGTFFGKKLYRKCFKVNGNVSSVQTGISNMEDLVNLMVTVKHAEGPWRTIPWTYNSNSFDSNYAGGAYLDATGSWVNFQAGSGLTNTSRFIVIMEYTKESL